MAGTFTAKSIADGQVAIAQGVLYTVPALTRAYVRQVVFYNTNAATQLLEVWLRRVGNPARKLRQFSISQNESIDLLDTGDTLEFSTGDTIEAKTSNGTSVDFMVMGVEES